MDSVFYLRVLPKFVCEDFKMLSVIFGDNESTIMNTSTFFKNVYEDDWIIDALSKDMIKDVDKSDVVSARVIDSPVLGGISPRELSGGVKTLICIYKMPDKVFNASNCGDNCAKWLLEIGEREDVTINLRHIMDFGDGGFEIYIKNSDTVVHNMKEMILTAGLFVR